MVFIITVLQALVWHKHYAIVGK